jgi:hypothetical protein
MKRVGTRYAKLVFLHPMGSMAHIVHFGASGCKTLMHYFSCSGGTGTGTRYAELVFLHPVGSAGHVVHSGASGAQNINAFIFVVGGARCGFGVKCAGTRYTEHVFLHPVSSMGHVLHPGHEILKHYFSCSSETNIDSIKSALGHVTLNLCFCILWDLWVTWCIPVHP